MYSDRVDWDSSMGFTLHQCAYEVHASLGRRGWIVEVTNQSGDVIFRRFGLPTKQSAIAAANEYLLCLRACGW